MIGYGSHGIQEIRISRKNKKKKPKIYNLAIKLQYEGQEQVNILSQGSKKEQK